MEAAIISVPFQVSAILPVHNGERFLAAAVESILAQDFPACEVIAVDDGSADSSVAILEKFPQVRLFRQSNQGVAAARNFGVSQAKGNAFAFLDQDDLWTPAKLRLQTEFLERNPHCGYVLGMEENLWEPDAHVPLYLNRKWWHEPYKGATPGSLLVTREFFEKVGPFDSRYNLCSDGDWIFRANDFGPRHHVPEVLLRKRLHSLNESRKIETMRAENLIIFREMIRRRRTAL